MLVIGIPRNEQCTVQESLQSACNRESLIEIKLINITLIGITLY